LRRPGEALSSLPPHSSKVSFPHAEPRHRRLNNLALARPDELEARMDPDKTRAGSEGEEPLPQAVKIKHEPGEEPHHPSSYNGAGSDVDVINGHLIELEVDLSRVIGEDDVEGDWDADTSPFPAVRAVVPETDDPAMPVNTLRAWFLGIVSPLVSSRAQPE
jgi:hypothetical protein